MEIGKLEYGLELLSTATSFDKAVGREPKPTAERAQRYQAAIATLKANKVTLEAEAAAQAAAAKAAVSGRKQPTASFTPQEIEIYGARKIEVTADGEVWIDGDKAGDITADGEIWVAGDKEGDVTSDGEVWKAGDKVGDITTDGEVWREGNKIGDIESDGSIWINGSREGWYTGGTRVNAAAIVFYGFFDI